MARNRLIFESSQLLGVNQQNDNFRSWVKSIHSDFSVKEYQVKIKISDQKTVSNACAHFPGFLFKLGPSPQRSEALAVKIEVVNHPPAALLIITRVTRKTSGAVMRRIGINQVQSVSPVIL